MPVRSTRLGDPVAVEQGTTATLFVVPDGRTAIVRSIRAVNPSRTVEGIFDLSVVTVTGDLPWVAGGRLPGGAVFNDNVWQVLEAGDELNASVDAGGPGYIAFWVSGALLAGDNV